MGHGATPNQDRYVKAVQHFLNEQMKTLSLEAVLAAGLNESEKPDHPPGRIMYEMSPDPEEVADSFK